MTRLILFVALTQSALAAEDAPVISPASRTDQKILVHDIRSTLQQGTTQIKVLLPDNLKTNHRYPVVYVLPVEAIDGSRYGDGLLEVKNRDLHNRHAAIFITPAFSHLPWYADHPTDPAIRQESHFLSVVLPFVEKTYPAQTNQRGRFLLGFSKSGWGAWSLLLRHPDLFARAAAWDAPLMMDRLGKYGTSPIFGTTENFERYRLTDLLRSQANSLRDSTRLVLTGYGNFHDDQQQMHALLTDLNIPHDYRDGPHHNHDWHSGWLSETVELLLNPTLPATSPK